MMRARILMGIGQVLALAFLVAPISIAQQGGSSARASSKAGESATVPAGKAGKKVAMNAGDAVRHPARSLDARCMQTEGAARVPVARLVRVDGSALMSTDTGLTAVTKGQALQEGARVWTTMNSSMVISYCDGCVVPLKANQHIEIGLSEPCAERWSQVESVLLDPIVVEGMAVAASGSMTAAVLAGVLPAATPLIGGIGLTGALAAIRNRENEAVSPN